MGQAQSLVVGVFSGVLASLLVFSAAWLVKNVLIPWYQGIVYKGVSLSGEWVRHWTLEDGVRLEAHYTLRHKGHRITGSEITTRYKDGTGVIQRKAFEIEGQISDRLVMLTSRHRDPTKISGMVLLLEVIGDGSKMSGCSAYYSVSDSKIAAARIEIVRPSVALEAEGAAKERVQSEDFAHR